LGHQQVLSKILRQAKQAHGIPAILTFSEHPLHVLRHKEPPYLITSTPHRLRLLDQLGFEIVFLISFDKRFSRQSPRDFVKNVLVNQLKAAIVVLGYDSRFGRNRKGTAKLMAEFAKKYGFRFFSVKPRLFHGIPISSTKLRSLIQSGDLAQVEKCLGRKYSIMADVVKGSGLGTTLGFPTANLNPHSEALPPKGVYFVSLEVVDVGLQRTSYSGRFKLRDKIIRKDLLGLLNIGVRPTVKKVLGRRTAGIVPEIHILNFSGNLYGKTLEVTFLKKIREEKKFDSLGSLKKQIKKDIEHVDKYKAAAAV